tara:strand:+ start:414 stop:728 length:315 start_codon:yes stop_codon:yes gene_type:complete
MNENKPREKKLFKITTHNIMIETFEVIAESKEDAELAVFDCWTAEDDYKTNVERIEQYFDDKRVENSELFGIKCDLEYENMMSTRSLGFWREPTFEEVNAEEDK